MALNAGTRLGSYEILGAIGSGGMGEVYRARDAKLDRDVAIKVLPSHLSSDPEALARFEREAKAVGALSHPNILAIHDFGRDSAAGVSYAVTELLEGETLRARVDAGALPLKKVVQIGVEVAHGLGAAHARGIIHRDIKPENIFLTGDGRVKILDFGLASPQAVSDDSPTAVRQTDPGTVLGTVGYMSPEQVKGQPVDARSDLFSMGCVLYELATGRRAFTRGSTAETMSAILRDDPPDFAREGSAILGTLAGIEPIVRHCLEKQPDERFQSARDLAFALQAVSASTVGSGKAAAMDGAPSSSRRLPVTTLAVGAALIAAAFLAGWMLAPAASSPAGALAFQQVTDDAGMETSPAISPDGVSVAFVRAVGNVTDIYVQRIGGRNAIPIAADPAISESSPMFSPDGTQIAFHASSGNGGIFIAGATGESIRRVTDFGFHPAWSPDSQRLVFCTEEIFLPAGRASTSAMWVVDAKGGVPAKLSGGDAVQPAWSPSGSRIAYWAVDFGQRDIYTIPAGGGERKAVTLDAALDWWPRWSADGKFLYFASDRGGAMNLWRIAIDEGSGESRGQPEPVTLGVTTADQPSLSRDGARIAFRSSSSSTNPIAISFDADSERVGPPRQILDRIGNLVPSGISPGGDWLALFNSFGRQEDVLVVRTDGTGLRRLTDDAFRDRVGGWSPDGKEIAFYTNRTGPYSIWAVKPDGSGLHALSDSTGGDKGNLLYPTYSPTGDRLVASRLRSDEVLLWDPRTAWSAQKPELLKMPVGSDSWLVPSAWSLDGRTLVGTITNASGSPLGTGVYDVASRRARKVAGYAPSFVGYVWLGDHRRVVVADSTTDTLWLLDVESGRTKVLATGFKLGIGLVGSPDRRTLYASTRREQADIWMMEMGKKSEGRTQK